MQTFLPYSCFKKSAEVLDYKRLGKQRVEAMQIVNVLEGRSRGWENHPCTRMWDGYVEALKLYHNTMVEEWVKRRYNNTMTLFEIGEVITPRWLGWACVHKSHRGLLLYKSYDFYKQYGWTELPSNNVYWPV